MQSVFVIITKLIASKKYFCKEVFCNNFGRDGTRTKACFLSFSVGLTRKILWELAHLRIQTVRETVLGQRLICCYLSLKNSRKGGHSQGIPIESSKAQRIQRVSSMNGSQPFCEVCNWNFHRNKALTEFYWRGIRVGVKGGRGKRRNSCAIVRKKATQ